MLCVKCKKDIPDGAPFCCWCGKKQIAEQKRTRRRARGTGTVGRMQIRRDVKSLIDQTGLTQEQLAERLGVTRLTVGRWYRGEGSPKAQAVFDIEEIVLSDS